MRSGLLTLKLSLDTPIRKAKMKKGGNPREHRRIPKDIHFTDNNVEWIVGTVMRKDSIAIQEFPLVDAAAQCAWEEISLNIADSRPDLPTSIIIAIDKG